YMEHVKNVVVPELSVQSKEEKEQFQVKLADAKRPDSTITCKCRVIEDEKGLNYISLLYKVVVQDADDDEMQVIRDLFSSTIFDPNVKDGLRWPLGKANSGGQYSVVAIWHTKTKAYNSSSTRLKLREANRFDFRETASEVTRDVNVMLTGLENLGFRAGLRVGCKYLGLGFGAGLGKVGMRVGRLGMGLGIRVGQRGWIGGCLAGGGQEWRCWAGLRVGFRD
ncbi:Bifunctional protein GlmU, partial [Bienertia sinuspersici]